MREPRGSAWLSMIDYFEWLEEKERENKKARLREREREKQSENNDVGQFVPRFDDCPQRPLLVYTNPMKRHFLHLPKILIPQVSFHLFDSNRSIS